MGIPAGVEAPVQAAQQESGRRRGGQTLAAAVRAGVHLNLNPRPVSGIGGGPRHQLPLPDHRHPQPQAGIVPFRGELGHQIPAPRIGQTAVVELALDGAQCVPRQQPAGQAGQVGPVEGGGVLFRGVAGDAPGPGAVDFLDAPDPPLALGEQEAVVPAALRRGEGRQIRPGFPGQEGEVPQDGQGGPEGLPRRGIDLPHHPLQAGPEQGLLPPGKEGGGLLRRVYHLHHHNSFPPRNSIGAGTVCDRPGPVTYAGF